MYIHLMEMSPHPERALRAGDDLRDLVPDSGHLQHMPTHIDVLCGDYNTVVVSNSRAIIADRKYLEREHSISTRCIAAMTIISSCTERCFLVSMHRPWTRPTR